MCESKVQVVVSLGRHWVLFALGRHWVLTNGTWHVLLQSGNVFELEGIICFVYDKLLVKIMADSFEDSVVAAVDHLNVNREKPKIILTKEQETAVKERLVHERILQISRPFRFTVNTLSWGSVYPTNILHSTVLRSVQRKVVELPLFKFLFALELLSGKDTDDGRRHLSLTCVSWCEKQSGSSHFFLGQSELTGAIFWSKFCLSRACTLRATWRFKYIFRGNINFWKLRTKF